MNYSTMKVFVEQDGQGEGLILELKALCKDYRLQICGRMMGAIDIFNIAICPSLLANCGPWVNISKETIKKLDSIQNLL